MMIIGIVGEAGAGKTTATDFFEKNGAYIISADSVVKYLYQIPKIEKKLIKAIGPEYITEENTINKVLLRKNAFQDLTLLTKLETVLWPELKKIIVRTISDNQQECLIIVDCAVLFNIKLDQYVDEIILVETNEQLKIKRLKERDNISENEIVNLLNLQKKHLILNKKVDYLIKNNGSISDFLSQLQKIAKKQKLFDCMTN